MSIAKLPYELVSYIVQRLDLDDVRNLNLTCRRFQYLVREENIAKAILEKKAPASLEALTARASKQYALQLRRLLKRREAVSSVSPYLAGIVAVAETWLFENGVLCYISDRQLRILDLHRSASSEIVVNIRLLLDKAIGQSWAIPKYKIQLLYYAQGIVSCLYTYEEPEPVSWLVIFNAREERILTARRLASASKIFVRNNDKFLYYGTHTDFSGEFRRWMIKGYDISANQWFKHKANIPEMAGSDIGSTICFEIIDGYFYGLSNQTTFEVTGTDLTSYYVCFRFPLKRRGFYEIEQAARKQMWRRKNTEGVIDDRWTSLRIFKDETTGMLKVVESRKEWPAGRSSARRNYYTIEISFKGALREPEWDYEDNDGLASDEDDGDDASDGPFPDENDGDDASDGLPDGDHETWDKIQSGSFAAPSRNPHHVHPGDDGSTQLMRTLSQCPVRSYHPSCQTFLDLVNDTSSSDSNDQQIRIRGGSRRRWSPDELQKRRRLPPAQQRGSESALDQAIHDIYKHEDVVLWPPEQDPARWDPALDELYTLLSPPSHRGDVHGTWDDRCLVYATGGTTDRLKAIIFVSFDPSIRLMGARPYSIRLIRGRPAGILHCGPRASSELHQTDPGSDPELSYDGKGKGKDMSNTWNSTLEPSATWHAERRPPKSDTVTSPPRAESFHHAPWSSFEKAMYRDISFALYFGL